MSGEQIGTSAEELRRELDAAFAAPWREAEPWVDLLTIRAGGQPFALRLSALSALAAGARVVPAPSFVAELVGLANVHGAVVPVYDLAALLGLRSSSDSRWLALAGSPPVALAFEEQEACVRVAPASIVSAERSERGFVEALVTIEGVARTLLDVGVLTAALVERSKAGSRSPRSDEDAR